ncbi:MAG TPA: phosphoribosyltransferase family protein [Gemmatimonadales bacterium]|jgi:putative phosphoribosyl transferase|nr:phosphoribosyltransferase family protein [Gemmatimonadales bacterium]
MTFIDRADAGRRLAARLEPYRRDEHGRPVELVVIGLPRGGVVVAAEVARLLEAPLDVVVVRKLGAPDYPEFAIGAIARGETVLNEEIDPGSLPPGYLDRVIATETRELERREALYRGGRAAVPVAGRTVLVVDDGLATGSTAAAAVRALRRAGPRRIVLAVPVAAPDSAARLARIADEVVCLSTPADFRAVSLWYRSFGQTSDEEVVELLQRARAPAPAVA